MKRKIIIILIIVLVLICGLGFFYMKWSVAYRTFDPLGIWEGRQNESIVLERLAQQSSDNTIHEALIEKWTQSIPKKEGGLLISFDNEIHSWITEDWGRIYRSHCVNCSDVPVAYLDAQGDHIVACGGMGPDSLPRLCQSLSRLHLSDADMVIIDREVVKMP